VERAGGPASEALALAVLTDAAKCVDDAVLLTDADERGGGEGGDRRSSTGAWDEGDAADAEAPPLPASSPLLRVPSVGGGGGGGSAATAAASASLRDPSGNEDDEVRARHDESRRVASGRDDSQRASGPHRGTNRSPTTSIVRPACPAFVSCSFEPLRCCALAPAVCARHGLVRGGDAALARGGRDRWPRARARAG